MNSMAGEMKTEHVPIDSVRVDEANVRKHSKRNLDTIKRSLEAFGQQKPIVVGADGVVVAGNGTLDAARALGWTHIDVVRTGLEGSARKAYAVADNRTAELAEWDEAGLGNLLASLQRDETFDETVTGFDETDIERLIGTKQSFYDAQSTVVEDAFQVLVTCDSEDAQRILYERLKGDGYICRVLTL